ncbi:hypothetical protein, partial [Stutzerimonas nitrititolerans]|uniref:hypothetical protein n=1 Tax=Stutzerimonas nitrititolerans TaxID=2482751 RepID=UPI0028A08325
MAEQGHTEEHNPVGKKDEAWNQEAFDRTQCVFLLGSPAFVDYCQLVFVEMVAALALVRCDGSLAVILARAPNRRPCAR